MFDLGKRAFLEDAHIAMRFLILDGHQPGWESAVCGATVPPGGVKWLARHVWPGLPWDHFVAWLLTADGVQCFDGDWFEELGTEVPSDRIFSAEKHIPLIIRELGLIDREGRDFFWPRLWRFMGIVGARGLKEAIECAAGCPTLKHALIRYVDKRRRRDKEINSIVQQLIPVPDIVQLVMDRADFVTVVRGRNP